MSYYEMYNRLHGMVPKIPIDLCKTFINDAWRDVRRKNLWSFQIFERNWMVPTQINTGTFNCTQGNNTVVASAAAAAAIIAAGVLLPTPITQRQFRTISGGIVSTIYNIWSWDGVNTLTLDRPYAEASAAAATYMIYQCYYPAPYQDHLTFFSVRDMRMFRQLFTTRYTRTQLDNLDPQRMSYYIPSDVVYYQQDQNPSSPTYRFPVYEIWGHPLYAYVYQLYGIRKLTDFTADGDTLPPALGEDCIIEGAKIAAYEWAEANKGDMPRNQGSDYKYLMGKATAKYADLYRSYRKDDRETVNNFLSVRRLTMYSKLYAYYSTLSGTAYPGAVL